MLIPRSPEWLLVLLLATSTASADTVDAATAAARERIAQERAAVERETQAAQVACAQQFAVSACVERANDQRRERLQRLAAERAVLDDDSRKRRAAARTDQIQQRQTERADERPAKTPRSRSPAASAAAVRPVHSRAAATSQSQAAASQAQAAAEQRAAAAAMRASQAQAHREAVEARNRDRATLRAPAKSLPPATAASQ